MKLGINGLGRIGKLTVWNHLGRKYFDELVVNVGRGVGQGLESVADYLQHDSTYGSLQGCLYGYYSKPLIEEVDEASGCMRIDGVKIKVLRSDRNPADIHWGDEGVRLVVDTTGKFLDPTLPPDHPGGSVRGHLVMGAEKVLVSAPFKIKDKSRPMPEDAVTTVMGINHNDYDPRVHKIVSNASCTTTCLAHMIKPLLNYFGADKIMSASMTTIHAATGSQAVLDRLPKSGASDLRKNRSILNNIILTTTGAAQALSLVIPEMGKIGFIAESVRVPTTTGSLIILVVNLQERLSGEPVRRDLINRIYQQAAEEDPNQYLYYTEKQNVSCDIIGMPRVATIIEAHETHTRTAEASIDLGHVPGLGPQVKESLKDMIIRIPVTQAVIYGWYDNELGSYVNIFGDRTVSVAESM